MVTAGYESGVPRVSVQRWTGVEARCLRHALRLSGEAFAALLGIDDRTIRRWEARGRDAVLRGASQSVLDEQLAQADETARARFEALLAAAGRSVDGMHPGPKTEATGERSARRQVVWGGTTAPDVATVLAQATAFQVADRRIGGGALYRQVVAYLNSELGPRLLVAAGGAELFTAAAAMTNVAGWMAHDSGHDQWAYGHFRSAYRLAVAADDNAAAANACTSMSHLAAQHGQSDDAVRIAGAGLERAQDADGTDQLTARLYAMRARALAIRGDRDDALGALDTARSTLAGATGKPAAEWVAGFDDASLASEAALCLRQLGLPDDAADRAREVIRTRTIDRVRSRSFAQLTLAGVLLDAGEIDEAAMIGRELCSVLPELTSMRVRARLDRLAAALQPHLAMASVRAFYDELGAQQSPTSIDPMESWPV